jgi:hypothetical protein
MVRTGPPQPTSDLPQYFPEGTNQQQREKRATHNRADEPSVAWRDEMPNETHRHAEEKEEEQLESVHNC